MLLIFVTKKFITQAAKSNASVAHLVHLCCYLLPKFLQIFTYAWYGNLIAEEVSNIFCHLIWDKND